MQGHRQIRLQARLGGARHPGLPQSRHVEVDVELDTDPVGVDAQIRQGQGQGGPEEIGLDHQGLPQRDRRQQQQPEVQRALGGGGHRLEDGFRQGLDPDQVEVAPGQHGLAEIHRGVGQVEEQGSGSVDPQLHHPPQGHRLDPHHEVDGLAEQPELDLQLHLIEGGDDLEARIPGDQDDLGRVARRSEDGQGQAEQIELGHRRGEQAGDVQRVQLVGQARREVIPTRSG